MKYFVTLNIKALVVNKLQFSLKNDCLFRVYLNVYCGLCRSLLGVE